MSSVNGLRVEAQHRYHVIADFGRQEIGHADNRGGAAARSGKPGTLGARGHDNDIGLFFVREGRVDLFAGYHVHALYLEHMRQVVLQAAQAFVLALHHFGEVEQAAQRAFLVQRHIVAALGAHASSLHASRAAADSHDLLAAIAGRHFEAFGHCLDEVHRASGVHAAGAAHAIQAAAAGANPVDAVFQQFVGVFGIAVRNSTMHVDKLQRVIVECLSKIVGGRSRVHEYHAAHGNLHELFHVTARAHNEAATRMAAVQDAPKVRIGIERDTVAHSTVVTIAGEAHVVDELSLVEGERTQAQLQRASAGSLDGLADGSQLLFGVHQGIEARTVDSFGCQCRLSERTHGLRVSRVCGEQGRHTFVHEKRREPPGTAGNLQQRRPGWCAYRVQSPRDGRRRHVGAHHAAHAATPLGRTRRNRRVGLFRWRDKPLHDRAKPSYRRRRGGRRRIRMARRPGFMASISVYRKSPPERHPSRKTSEACAGTLEADMLLLRGLLHKLFCAIRAHYQLCEQISHSWAPLTKKAAQGRLSCDV